LKGKGLARAGTIIGSIPVIFILIFTIAIILTPHNAPSNSSQDCYITWRIVS
jgi:amino acid transporter